MEQLNKDIERALATAMIRLRKVQSSGQGKSTTTDIPSKTLSECGLANVNCPICNNTGVIIERDKDDPLTWHTRDCECMKKRVAIRSMKNSGMSDAFIAYTLDNYNTPSANHEKIKNKAKEFITTGARGFLVFGNPGSGKTHICTAICSELIQRGYEAKYFMWRKDAAELKGMVNDPEYKKRLNQLRNIPILYIDDFYKGTITEADSNLAFTIINDRYMSPDKKTIISTERTPEELISVDEATGSRIIEMCKGFVLKSPDNNWRLK